MNPVAHAGLDARPAFDAGPSPLVLLRPARLTDVPAVSDLLDEFARRGQLLPRTRLEVYRHIRDFVVAADATGVIGCAGLRIYSATLAEIVGLAVADRCHGRGVGGHLVRALVDEARGLGLRRVFALTLRDGFFHRLGFRTVPVSEFPEKIALDCAGCARRATCIEIAVVRDLDP